MSRPIRVIHSGHDLRWLANMPMRRPAECLRIGYIGQVTPIKGVHTLVAALALLAKNNKVRLQIYGDTNQTPDYTNGLRQTVLDAKLAVEFCGPFAHARLGEVLANIDILVTPSEWPENNPRVIQEAFASRLPVLASDVGGIAEFVQHDVNGLLFPRGDAQTLANHIQRILDEPGLLAQLRSGISPVRQLADEVDELLEVYAELISLPASVGQNLLPQPAVL